MPEWGYSPRYKSYRNLSNGQWASRKQVQGWVADNLALADTATDALANMMSNDLLRLGDWQTAMRQQIKKSYSDQYILGKGGIEQMTQADWGSLGGQLSNQYRHLDNFANDVASGKLSEGGPGSGHHGHAGVPGKRGGSAPSAGGGGGGVYDPEAARIEFINSPPRTGANAYGDPRIGSVGEANDASYRNSLKRAKYNESQEEAVRDYQNAGFGTINAFLRGDETIVASWKGKRDAQIRELDAVVSSRTAMNNYIVYRAWGEDIKPKSGFKDNGFVSVTTSKGVAEEFAGKFGGSVTKIVIPAGTKVGFIANIGSKGEGEILLGRGGTFQRRKLSDGSFGFIYHGPP